MKTKSGKTVGQVSWNRTRGTWTLEWNDVDSGTIQFATRADALAHAKDCGMVARVTETKKEANK